MPIRIQLSRKKGWRKPPNTVVVARPSKWGNPYKAGTETDGILTTSVQHAIDRFRKDAYDKPIFIAQIRSELKGKNLGCWCREGSVCHGDVLLEIANS